MELIDLMVGAIIGMFLFYFLVLRKVKKPPKSAAKWVLNLEKKVKPSLQMIAKKLGVSEDLIGFIIIMILLFTAIAFLMFLQSWAINQK